MKNIKNKLLIIIILGIVILISGCSEQSISSYYDKYDDYPRLSIDPDEYDFGFTTINSNNNYEFDVEADTDYYKKLDIKSIIISDNINFILDALTTDTKNIHNTSFKVIFNPKSRGIFNAIIMIKTNDDENKDNKVHQVIVTGRVPEEITAINSNIKHYVNSNNSIILSWDKAVDDIDNQSQLQYLVVYSTTADKMDTVANIESKISEGNAAVYDTWYRDINTIEVIGIIPGLEYYFNIIAKDTTGNKISYNPISFTYIYPTTLQITSFKFETSLNAGAGITIDCIGSIYNLSVNITVPETTDLTNLISTFTTNAQKIEIGSVMQTSGVTVNDFTKKLYYKITATDGSQAFYLINLIKK